MLRVGKGYKRLSSRSSDLRISSIARLLGVTQWPAFACATPTRLQRRHRSGFSPDSLFSLLSHCGRRSTRHDSVVIDIIRTGGAFVNGVLPDRGKSRVIIKRESDINSTEHLKTHRGPDTAESELYTTDILHGALVVNKKSSGKAQKTPDLHLALIKRPEGGESRYAIQCFCRIVYPFPAKKSTKKESPTAVSSKNAFNAIQGDSSDNNIPAASRKVNEKLLHKHHGAFYMINKKRTGYAQCARGFSALLPIL